MANLSKIKLGSTIYSLKDSTARDAVSRLETAVSSALVFKGTVSSATGITGLTNYYTGWTYKATANFTIPNVGIVEPGDMIICIKTRSTYNAADWTVVQNNVDVMTGATASANGTRGLVPSPAKTDTTKFLRGDGTWQPTGSFMGRFTELV